MVISHTKFSFYEIVFTTIEGGAVITNDDDLAKKKFVCLI